MHRVLPRVEAATRSEDLDIRRPPRCSVPERRFLMAALTLGAASLVAGCAGLLGREPVKVSLVGLESLPGQGLELRFALKLRVINPNDAPIDYDGLFLALAVRGSDIASGVSAEKGSVPRFGESVITVPVTVTGMAIVRQVLGMAASLGGAVANSSGSTGTGTGSSPARMDYQLRGRLSGTGLGSVSFSDSGQLDWPNVLRSQVPASPTAPGTAPATPPTR